MGGGEGGGRGTQKVGFGGRENSYFLIYIRDILGKNIY